MRPESWARFLALTAVLASLVAAAIWSIRIGWSDYLMRQETIRSTERAIAILPGQAESFTRLAWLASTDDPPKAEAALRRAVALNPSDARSWIELGLLAEAQGGQSTSTQCLIRAAQVDHTFLPRWTLANYYFRHNNPAQFWFWAKQAATMVYGDAQPLFKLCAQVVEDGTLIDRLQIRDPDIRAAYLSYLLSQGRADLSGPSIRRLLRDNRDVDTPLLLAACDGLIEARLAGEAAVVWNGLAAAGRVPFRAPAGEGAQLIANGGFAATPASRGFDWRLPAVEGVSISQEEEARGLRVTFSGLQPEECEVLVQLVPLPAKTQFQLRFDYRTQGSAGAPGLEWRITDSKTGAVLIDLPWLPSEAGRQGQQSFETPAECRLARLALLYHRTPGYTRFEGYLLLRDVALQPTAQLPMDGARVKR